MLIYRIYPVLALIYPKTLNMCIILACLMGTILTSRTKEDGKIVFEILVDYEEALQLKGSINNVHLFSEDVADIETRLTQRGKNESTYYFLVPKDLRKDLKFKGAVKCQKIETKTKTMFIYVIDKIGLR
jgi:hypothetical protein